MVKFVPYEKLSKKKKKRTGQTTQEHLGQPESRNEEHGEPKGVRQAEGTEAGSR